MDGGGGGGYGGYGGGSAPNYMNYGTAGVGSNQYQNLPPWMNTRTAYNTPPGVVPQQGQTGSQYYGPGWTGAGGGPILGGGQFSVEQSMDPSLTQGLFNYLQGQIGRGVTPFNLRTALPFGGVTQPGQINAPGNQALETIATQGISALPEWQQMIAAQQQNIAQGRAGLEEQMGFMGNLAGSPGATGLANYDEQTVANQNALLGQLQQQNILQGQIPVAEYTQGMNQQAIQNVMNEFMRTQPQYNPLLSLMFGGATSFNPVLNRAGQTGGGILGGLAQGAGSAAQMAMLMAAMGG